MALGELLAADRQPVLVLNPPTNSDEHAAAAWIEQAASLLADLAIAQPRLSLCLLVEHDWLRIYLDKAAESRAKALVRESVVTIAARQPETSSERPRKDLGNTGSSPDQARARLVRRGAAARLLSLFDEAASAVDELRPESSDPAKVDRARSAAERFLYERLEAMPETAGLFRLNETIGPPLRPQTEHRDRPRRPSLNAGGRDRRLLSLPGSRRLSPRPAQGPGASETRLPGRPRAGRGRGRGPEEAIETILAAVAFRRMG